MDQAGDTDFGGFNYACIGRLTDGVSTEAAARDLQSLLPQMSRRSPYLSASFLKSSGLSVEVYPYLEQVVGPVQSALWTLMATIDGMELYEPYHLQEMGGVFGIIDLEALAGVELKTGGFGVEYGDKIGGVLNMKSATALGPPRGTADVNVSHVSLTGQGGFAGDRGSWLASARVGSIGLLMKLGGSKDHISPDFYDTFEKVSYHVAPGHLVTLHMLRAGDAFRAAAGNWDGFNVTPYQEEGEIRSDWDSSYLWATWQARLAERVSSTTQLWEGSTQRRRSGFIEDAGGIATPQQIDVRDYRAVRFRGLRGEVRVQLLPNVLLRAGGELVRAHADYDYYGRSVTPTLDIDRVVRSRDDTVSVVLTPEGRSASGFAALRLRVGGWMTTELGARVSRVSQTRETHVAPRVEASVRLPSRTTLRASAGRYVQPQGIGDLQVGDGQTLYSKAELSDLIALGLERRLLPTLSVKVEGYDRRIADQQPRFIGLERHLRVFPERQEDRLRLDPGIGRARGVEVFLEGRPNAGWNWSASYALAKAEDEIPQTVPCDGGPTCLDDAWVPRSRDQRHSLDLQAEYHPNERWSLSAAWTFHTGWPATAWTYHLDHDATGDSFITRIFDQLRGDRLPAYHRLDLRATREVRLGRRRLDVYGDVINVYGRTNCGAPRYLSSFDSNGVLVGRHMGCAEELLPFVPMVGLRYRF